MRQQHHYNNGQPQGESCSKSKDSKTNYTPYIIGGVILLAILAALIF